MGKKIKNTLIYLLTRLLMGFVHLLGFERSRRFGRWLGRRAFGIAHSEREKALANLKTAFEDMAPDERRDLLLQTFEHFGMAAAEVVNAHKIKNLTSYVEFDPDSRRVLDDVVARGRGVVFVTAHCGNWELMTRTIARLGYPVNTIGKASYDPRFTRLIEKFRNDGMVNTIWRGDEDIIEKMTAAIRRGELLGFLNDQDTKVPGVFAPFFGKLAYTPSAAAILFRKTGASVVCGFNHRREDGGYRVVVEEYQPVENDDFDKAVEEDITNLTACIEKHIRAHPAEWVWMHRRWKTRP